MPYAFHIGLVYLHFVNNHSRIEELKNTVIGSVFRYYSTKFYKQYRINNIMDEFDKDFPDFDWKNTPAYKHPGGKNCPCPKHEYIREQINYTKQINESGKDSRITLKFCPEHYQVYMNEVIPAMPLKYKILTKIALKIGAIKVVLLKYMESELCFYCRFGSGGHGKKNELPPV